MRYLARRIRRLLVTFLMGLEPVSPPSARWLRSNHFPVSNRSALPNQAKDRSVDQAGRQPEAERLDGPGAAARHHQLADLEYRSAGSATALEVPKSLVECRSDAMARPRQRVAA